jgi:hypothetical protein
MGTPVGGDPTSGPHAESGPTGTRAVSKRPNLEAVVRAVAPASAAGALLGVLVGGVGGRLVMGLLAAQNPEDTGVISDDGFRIGQFTVLGTLQLLLTSLQMALLGAVTYLVLRKLTLGPRWLGIVELTIGGTAAVTALVIHPGVDFDHLEPAWLAIVLFATIPAVFVPLLCLLAERWLAPDSWFATAPVGQVGAMLLVWVLGGPLLVLLPVVLGIGVAWRRAMLAAPANSLAGGEWVARALVGLIGIGAVLSLASHIDAVT